MNRFLDALAIIALLALVILTGLLAVPVRSESPIPAARMSLDGSSGHCFAVVVIENRVGVYHRDETLETDRGPVVVNYTTVGGHKPGHDDQLSVVSLPGGVTADRCGWTCPVATPGESAWWNGLGDEAADPRRQVTSFASCHDTLTSDAAPRSHAQSWLNSAPSPMSSVAS